MSAARVVPRYDPAAGLLCLPKAHLEAIVAGQRDVLDPATPSGALLTRLGVVRARRIDPALRDLLGTLRRPHQRFALRIDAQGAVRLHRGWVSDAGVVTVSGDLAPGDLQEIAYTTRPTAVARVVFGLLALAPGPPVARLPECALTWEAVVRPVRAEASVGWAAAAFEAGAAAPLRLAHLRWSADGVTRASTALVVLSCALGGLVEARPDGGLFRLVDRCPTDLWTRLCALARHPGPRPGEA